MWIRAEAEDETGEWNLDAESSGRGAEEGLNVCANAKPTTIALYTMCTARWRGRKPSRVLLITDCLATPVAVSDGGMETSKLYRGRLIDHLQLVVRDLGASRRFYSALLDVLGVPLGGEGPGFFWADELVVSSVDSPASSGRPTGRAHLAFQARDRAMVDRCYAEAVKAGGKDNGAPGERPYHPGYYAAFVLDPDGNNVEVVFHGPAKKSASAIEITF